MFNPSCPQPLPPPCPAPVLHGWAQAAARPTGIMPICRLGALTTLLTRLVIASGNPHKVTEIREMLALVDLEVVCQPKGLEIEETGRTYAENARLKAETVARLCGEWALADDSGLEVDALQGRPGLYSARYAPTDPEKIHRLLHELGDGLYRGARFVSAMAVADPQGTTRLEGFGLCYGLILHEPDGVGAGYDPVFYVREAGCSYARMSAHLKSKLGSRGKAARSMAPQLVDLLARGRRTVNDDV